MTETAPRERPPAPTSVSAEAQAYLGATNPFARSASAPESLDDTEGWLRYIKTADDGLIKVMGQRLPADLPIERTATEIGGVPTFVFRPTSVPDEADTPIFLDIHGGALVMGGGEACAVMTTPGALGRPMITWAVDYRMPPLHRYPASLDDCITVYRALLNERPPEKIFVGGASAGGNLAAALMLRAKDEGLPMPAGLVLLSPEVDLTESGDSFATNLGIDHVLGLLINTNRLYAGGADLSHPYLSPLFGDVSGFPPTFLQTGTRDLFLSNTVRMHRKLRNAGVDAELHVWEAMPHGGLGGSPEDAEIGVEVRRFLDRLRS